MDLCFLSYAHVFSFGFILMVKGILGATFTFTNNCQYTVWPGILSNAGSPELETTGFELPQATTRTLQAPTGWSGRFWGRTGCSFDTFGQAQGSCTTGDCGSTHVECAGSGATPPSTLAEFTLGVSGGLDFYDVSLVDGYNLPMAIVGSGGSGTCGTTGCVADLNRVCPAELRVGEGEGCRSACEAFGTPEYCCSGEFGTPDTCRPSVYSQMFKAVCPTSYSYAYDDATSTFTCNAADYEIVFCPSVSSEKASKDPPPTTTETGSSTGTGLGYTGSGGSTGTESAGTGSASVMLTDDSWLASLATADSWRLTFQHETAFTATIVMFMALLLL